MQPIACVAFEKLFLGLRIPLILLNSSKIPEKSLAALGAYGMISFPRKTGKPR
jgi:hypothetical protein